MADKKNGSSGGKKSNSSTTKRRTSAKNTAPKASVKSSTRGRRKKKKYNSKALGEAAFFFILAFALIIFLSYFGLTGKFGTWISAVSFGTFGVLAYLFPFNLVFFILLITKRDYFSGVARVKFATAMFGLAFIGAFIELIVGNYKKITELSKFYNFEAPIKSGGGIVGGAICKFLTFSVGEIGAYIVTIVFVIAAIVVISERSLLGGIKNGSKKVITSAKDDINEYREETEKKRAIREAATLEEERHKRFDKSVKGVDFSIEIPGTKKRGNVLGPKTPEADNQRTRNNPVIPDNGEVKEVFQNEKFSENIDEIIDINPNTSYNESSFANKHNVTEIKPLPGATTQETDMDEDYEAFSGGRSNSASATSSTVSSDAQTTSSVSSTSRSSARKSASESTKMATSDKSKEQVDAEISEEIRHSEELTEEIAEEVYQFPPIELLQRARTNNGTSEKELHDTAMKLQQTLSNFGVKVTVSDVSCGPAVTRYEIQPEQGVKVSRIVSLADDIKLNLAAADIRIEAPIPGKAAVGIEVPNRETSGVCLRELIESKQYKDSTSPIAFGVGKDIAGQVVVSDIAKMPHVLIAGATGSGKSVCINTIIMSILYRAKPSEVKMIMIDPKVVELSVYNGIPHLMIPVVTDSKKAAGALNWAVAEMDDRYKKFADCGVRDLKGYNAKVEQIKDIDDPNKPTKLPQLVIIVDELADLMMVAKNEVEDAIVRLAQLARAAGIHLVIATQRPSVDVITGLIKANVPSRIAFAVSSGVDSRTILDMVGAEKLLGKGDMLFSPAGYPKPARVQGAFVSDNEVSAVVDFLKSNCGETGVTYRNDITEKINNPGFAESQAFGSDYDEYFAEAGRYLIEKGKGSVSILQRMYRIGFNRAARIMDQLEEAGVMGPEEGTKPRKVLMTMEEFEELLSNM